ncbi:MAG TPA: hypothetical protein VKG24_23175 [Pseudolabrys sp.]|nr:hypothetical protein [Pseudolabrys sp.]
MQFLMIVAGEREPEWEAIPLLLNAITQGHLTPDEASALSLVAERSMAVISQQEILKRIEILEKDRELLDARNFKTP